METTLDLTRPEASYLLGFIQTDGHLHQGTRNRGKLRIELSVGDVAILEQLGTLLPARTTISFRTRDTNFKKGCKSATLTMCDQGTRTLLNQMGIPYGKKSDIVGPPPFGTFSKRDYYRGVLDGDGSVGYTGQGLPFVSLATKSPSMCEGFEAFLFGLTGKHKSVKPNKRDQMYNLMVTKEDAQIVAKEVYQGSTISLARKHQAALKVLDWVRPDTMVKRTWETRRWTPEEDEVVLTRSPSDAATILNRTLQSVKMRAYRLEGR